MQKACSKVGIKRLLVSVNIAPSGKPSKNVLNASFQFKDFDLYGLTPLNK